MAGTKRKRPIGIGATAKAKKAKTSAAVATPAFTAAVKKAVKKAEQCSLETYYSDFGILWASSSAQASGSYSPGGFQASGGAAANAQNNNFGTTTNAHVLSLPAQISVGTPAGTRKGQHLQPIGFQWWMRGWLQNMTVFHDFHFVIAKWRGGSAPQTGQYPATVAMQSLQLFENGSFGSGAGSFNTANTEFLSASRINRDLWDVKIHKKFVVKPPPAQAATNSPVNYKAPVKFDGYYKFKEKDWDYQTNSGTSIKGGDYFAIFWQESNEPTQDAVVPAHFVQCNMELSFKDA